MGFPLSDKPAEVESYNNEPNPEVQVPYDPAWDYGDDEDIFTDDESNENHN